MFEKLKVIAGNYTKANFSYFVEASDAEGFNGWLEKFAVDKTSIPPPFGEVVPSSDHEEGSAASWYVTDGMVYGVTTEGKAYAIPSAELDSMPEIALSKS